MILKKKITIKICINLYFVPRRWRMSNSSYLVTPYSDVITEEQRHYKQKISSCRQVVDRAVDLLNG